MIDDKFWLRLFLSLQFVCLLFACGPKNPDPVQSNETAFEKNPSFESSIAPNGIKVVHIGDMMWTSSNISYEIPGSYCISAQDCERQRRLYLHDAAIKVCGQIGAGWRLPTLEDLKELSDQIGGYYDFMTEVETGDAVAANEFFLTTDTPFQIRYSGFRGSNGGFDRVGEVGMFWTSTIDTANTDRAMAFNLYPRKGKLTIRPISQSIGLSCLCLMQ